MQVLLLGLFVAIYLHDAGTAVEVYRGGELDRILEALPGDVWPGLSGWAVLGIVLVPKVLAMGVYGFFCRRTRRRLGEAGGQKALNLLEAMTAALPFLLLVLFIVDLTAGALRWLRVGLQHVVLIDEVLVMLPTLAVVVLAWAMYYPVDRRLREAAIMRDADHGRPVYPLLSRGGYVAMQLRHQFGLLLIPLLAVFGWAEALVLIGPDHAGRLSTQAVNSLTPVGVLGVLTAAPLIIRYVWQTQPLAEGEVRQSMLALCKLHKVRVRELLLWQTSGRMVNAAVTGLVSKVRYILLSDGLLDQLGAREVEAVMAHELAHVKHKHLFWMGLAIIAMLGTLEAGGYAILDHTPIELDDPNLQMAAISLPALIITLLLFGWLSRRVERQADVFAARHLAMTAIEKQYDETGNQLFDETSVQTMVHALKRVCELNHIQTHAKGFWQDLMHWRHGTIAWRQQHLRSLVGTPLNQAPVDRVLGRVKIATMLGLVVTLLLYFV